MKVGTEISKRFITNVFGTLAGFLGTVLFTRELGFAGIGAYAIFFSIQMMVANFVSFGLYPTVIKRVSEKKHEARQFTSGGLILLGGVTVAAVGSLVFRDLINQLMGVDAAVLIPLSVLSWGLFRLSGSFLEGKQRVALVGAIENGRYALIVPIQGALVLRGFGVLGLIWGLIIGQFLVFVISYVGFARVIPARPSLDLFREFMNYSKYAYVQSVSSQLFKQADYILLGQFVGPGPTGVYRNVFRLTEASMLFSSALAQVTFPRFSALMEEGDDNRITRLLASIFTYAGILSIPMIGGGAVIGNALLMTIYANDPGTISLPVIGTVGMANALLPILAVANLLSGYREGLENFFLGTNRPRFYAISGVLLIFVYALLAVPLTLLFGTWGVAWATVLAFGASVSSLLLFLEEQIPTSALIDGGTQIVSMLVMTCVVFALKLQLGTALGWSRIALLLGVGAGTYFTVLLTLSKRIRIDAIHVARDLHNEIRL